MTEFEYYIQTTGIYGTVQEIKHPIVYIKGLPEIHPNETIVFEGGQIGQVLDIDHNEIRALVFSNRPTKIGERVARTKKQLQTGAGEALLGHTIDPMGNILQGGNVDMKSLKFLNIFNEPPGISDREKIKKPFITGITKVDLLLPLGCGQRELIIGDVKTGKTTFLLTILQGQIKNPDTIAIYTAIGKRRSEIKQLEEKFNSNELKNRIMLIATSSSDAPSIHYLAPYVAMSHAEYFKNLGINSVVIFDDLSTHAQSYREISLLSRRFPGRESYPGDIFYAHASLLERAGNFHHPEKKQVSITCLPIANIVEGDITGYISTNLMGMTDGHILFDTNIYNKGYRPAINIPLSVTRVGRQTQNNLLREITVEILSILTQFEKVQNISQLGTELSEDSKKILVKGKAVETVLHQEQVVIPRVLQIILFGIVWLNMADFSEKKTFDIFLEKMLELYNNPEFQKQVTEITSCNTIAELHTKIRSNNLINSLCNPKT